MMILKALDYQTKTLPNGCHVVTSHKATIDGRPAIKWEGKKIPMYRYVYAKAHGTSVTALEGKEILHSCDNPQCVNPKHLSRGSHKANMKDMAKKGRSRNGATGPLKLTLNKSYKLHYKTTFQGMPISIENDKGSYRSWKDDQGNEGMTFMAFPYGYINMTMGTDGDHVDVYIGPDQNSHKVFVVHQNRPDTGEFDEDKCMLGFKNAEDAKGAYLHQYDDPRFFGEMDEYHIDDFKQMLKDRKGMKIKNDNLQKAKGYPVGTIREWQGKKYKKGSKGWTPVPTGTKDGLSEFPKTKGNVNSAGVPYQPTDDIDQLYDMVEAATPDFQKFVALLDKAVHADGIKMRKTLKSRDRVAVKVAEDYEGDNSRILDINGGTLIFDDMKGIERLRKAVAHLQPPVIRIKDRFKKPAMGGYMDYMANVTMPNGVVVEILATTSGIMKEKSEGIGHQIYEITRALPQEGAGMEMAEIFDALVGLSEKSYLAAAANDSARSAEIGIEFNRILPVLAAEIGSLLPDEVIRKNWFPDLTTGTSSQSQNVSLFDIASSINSIGVGDGLSKSIILKSSMEVMDMNTGKRAPLYKVKVHTAGELVEKAKNAAIGTQATHGGKKVVKTADGWKPVKSQKHGQSSAETKKKFEKPDTSDPRYDKGAPKGSPQEAEAKKRADTSDPRYDRGAPKGSPQEAAAKKRSGSYATSSKKTAKDFSDNGTAQEITNAFDKVYPNAKIGAAAVHAGHEYWKNHRGQWVEMKEANGKGGDFDIIAAASNGFVAPKGDVPRAESRIGDQSKNKPLRKSRKLVFFPEILAKGK